MSLNGDGQPEVQVMVLASRQGERCGGVPGKRRRREAGERPQKGSCRNCRGQGNKKGERPSSEPLLVVSIPDVEGTVIH